MMNTKITIDILEIGEFIAATFLAREDMRNIGLLIQHKPTGCVICVDAPSAHSILNAAQQLNWCISHLLITHHHWDHVFAIAEIKQKTHCLVYGCLHTKITPVDYIIKANEIIDINGIQIHTIATPGHCADQIAYYIPKANIACVADAIFNLGCGRILDGTPEQMFETLQVLKKLPHDTWLWYGHDYLAQNLNFQRAVDPENQSFLKYMHETMIDQKSISCPVMLQQECAANLFLQAPDLDSFTKLRKLRDGF